MKLPNLNVCRLMQRIILIERIKMTEAQNSEDDLFEQYLNKKIVPLIEQSNKLKDTYRGRFWGFLWTMMFLICANTLFVLFNHLIYEHPLNIEQILFLLIAAILVVIWPLRQYKKKQHPDIFAEYLRFYGDWQSLSPSETVFQGAHMPILPLHDKVQTEHGAKGTYCGADVKLSEVIYKRQTKTVGRGVVAEILLPQNIQHQILLFAKGGFYHKNKYENMTLLNEQIFIPAAAYFNIFSPEQYAPKKLLCSPFFEKILDVRDVFKTNKIYLYLNENKVFVYMESSTLYSEKNGLWQPKIKKESFKNLHKKFAEVFMFIELMQELSARGA